MCRYMYGGGGEFGRHLNAISQMLRNMQTCLIVQQCLTMLYLRFTVRENQTNIIVDCLLSKIY